MKYYIIEIKLELDSNEFYMTKTIPLFIGEIQLSSNIF